MAKKVLVMSGGFSSEREVSLVTGTGVAAALREAGYEVVAYDLRDFREFIDVLEKEKPDVVFNALHGNYGEDGTIQGFLDLMQIPYTHSGVAASVAGMRKDITREVAKSIGIKTAPAQIMSYRAFKAAAETLARPFVVKPVSDGSSVGVFIVADAADLKNVVYHDDDILLLAEKYIPGRELTVMVLEDKAYTVTELRPKVGFYDYKAKYTDGMTEHLLPAPVSDETAEICKDYAVKIHRALGCNTVSRSDFRYNPEDGVVLLEINTNPGLTPLSLVPEQAKYAGISYKELCVKLVEGAKCRLIPSL